ncbi:MAG: elongation factor P maturation arginine rhamnosyltransferase EarP [Burkholderiales bacterium]|nr:elongation factor P maturation arginine rhamnosyltransferase EarP [Burkholderiales bacterium]
MRDWHIFCRVVDNYGDAGVGFRLAKQLANEFSIDITLWIDNLAVLAKIQPQVDPSLNRQTVFKVNISRLTPNVAPPDIFPDVIIDIFGGGLPRLWLDALARDFPAGNNIPDNEKPLWIVLEYLSAEAFVDDLHGKPSPPPNIDIPRRFFFPGFNEKSGGLLRERDLISLRDIFLQSPESRKIFFAATLGVPSLPESAMLVSVFCYDTPTLSQLFDVWNQSATPIIALIPEGVADHAINQWHGIENALRIVSIPLISQDEYDQLLWTCDLNFVRGEDSLVRAIWAGKPFVWQAYRQENKAHMSKLSAFLTRYLADAQESEKVTLTRFTLAWNAADETSPAVRWSELVGRLPALTKYAHNWQLRQSQMVDLASSLIELVRDMR